jgi:PLD-like domain
VDQDLRPQNQTLPLPWISELVEATARLSGEQLFALTNGLNNDEAPTSASLRRLGLPTAEAVRIAKKLSSAIRSGPEVKISDLSIVLQAISAGRAFVPPQPDIEVVCTAPFGVGVPVRTTFATSMDMIRCAKREILVVGYLFTEGAREVLQELSVADRERSVAVTFVGNRLREHLGLFRSIWTAEKRQPRFLSREADPNDVMAAMHAKLLVCDRCDALVTSANLSSHGLHRNIEIGVRVRSPSMSVFVELIDKMAFGGELQPVELEEIGPFQKRRKVEKRTQYGG